MSTTELKQLLHQNGFRATKARVDVLAFVEKQDHPVGVEVLEKQFPKINAVTLYRMAAAFVEKGIWHAVDLGHGHVDYELASKPHHHHAVCNSCGVIEEIYGCESECNLITSARAKTEVFSSFKTANATLFGTCTTCAQ